MARKRVRLTPSGGGEKDETTVKTWKPANLFSYRERRFSKDGGAGKSRTGENLIATVEKRLLP